MEVPVAGLFRLVALTALVGVPVCAAAEQKLGQQPDPSPVLLNANLAAGWIEGVVTDDRHRPVAGAAVTAQGRDFLVIETDASGRFAIGSVPAGTYVVRVQGRGFVASRSEFVQVVASRGTRYDVRLRPTAAAPPVPPAPRVMAATVGASPVTASGGLPVAPAADAPAEEAAGDGHDHSPAAWRLRHLKRSVLRETTAQFDPAAIDEEVWRDASRLPVRQWAMDLGRAAGSFVTGSALSGRVQLLTTGAFDQPFEGLASDDLPNGIAYVNLAGPISPRTSWSVEAAAANGSVSSWFVGGSYATVLADHHGVDVRSSYSRQRYDGGNPAALAAFHDESRNVGGVQVVDRWTISSRALLTVGGRVEHYDYLRDGTLFSPSLSMSVSPASHTWLRGTVAQQMTAPGAEEFVPLAYGSLVLPPQRTFAPLDSQSGLGRQVLRHAAVALEQDVATFRVGIRHFRQSVEGQLVTVFGLESSDGSPRIGLGHYSVAAGGSFSATGWSFGVSRPVASCLRGSVEYRMADAGWAELGDAAALRRWAPSAVRGASERVHDVTTRVDADLPITATRVLAVYRFSTRYTRDDIDELTPGPDTRFDVQVYQGLPFLAFSRAKLELVFAVRNLSRDTRDAVASVYDELLVVRPPKRVVGGLTVQF